MPPEDLEPGDLEQGTVTIRGALVIALGALGLVLVSLLLAVS